MWDIQKQYYTIECTLKNPRKGFKFKDNRLNINTAKFQFQISSVDKLFQEVIDPSEHFKIKIIHNEFTTIEEGNK